MRKILLNAIFAILCSASLLDGGIMTVYAQEPLITKEGVESSILATTSFHTIEEDGSLLVDSLDISPGGEFRGSTGSTPEIISISSGSVSIEDGFGFGSDVPEGSAVALSAGSDFLIANKGMTPATVLRIHFLPQEEEMATPIAQAESSPIAQPVIKVKETNLGEIAILSTSNPATVFLGHVSLTPGTSTGEQVHDGPLAVFVESGSISVLSPSGLEGNVSAGSIVGLPAETPLFARTTDESASFYIVGITTEPKSPFTETIPPPTPTPEPTPIPSPTAIPSPTPEPTVDPAIEQELYGWLANYAELRSACDTFAIADLYAEPSSDEWAAIEDSLPCKYADEHVFWFDGNPQIRISGNEAMVGFSWFEELIGPSGCNVYSEPETLSFEYINGEWSPVDDETFGTNLSFSRQYGIDCQMLSDSE